RQCLPGVRAGGLPGIAAVVALPSQVQVREDNRSGCRLHIVRVAVGGHSAGTDRRLRGRTATTRCQWVFRSHHAGNVAHYVGRPAVARGRVLAGTISRSRGNDAGSYSPGGRVPAGAGSGIGGDAATGASADAVAQADRQARRPYIVDTAAAYLSRAGAGGASLAPAPPGS